VGNSNGITVIGNGRLSDRSGSGSFRQSDGCVGRWTATATALSGRRLDIATTRIPGVLLTVWLVTRRSENQWISKNYITIRYLFFFNLQKYNLLV
jgi:hypothetical protein